MPLAAIESDSRIIIQDIVHDFERLARAIESAIDQLDGAETGRLEFRGLFRANEAARKGAALARTILN